MVNGNGRKKSNKFKSAFENNRRRPARFGFPTRYFKRRLADRPRPGRNLQSRREVAPRYSKNFGRGSTTNRDKRFSLASGAAKERRQHTIAQQRLKRVERKEAKLAEQAAIATRTFGPPPEAPVAPATGDRSILVELNVRWYDILQAISGLVNIASAHPSFQDISNLTPDLGYVAVFLTRYLLRHWVGDVQTYPLSFAPCVFWDLCDAGTPRVCGDYSYRVARDADILASNSWTNANYGFPWGLISGGTGGYSAINTADATNYTDAAGFIYTKYLFERLPKVLDCVARDSYRQISETDPSLFHESRQASTYQSSAFGFGQTAKTITDAGVVSDVIAQFIHVSHQKPKCKWIGRLRFFQLSTTGGNFQYGKCLEQSYTLSSGIVAHRVYHKLRGYDQHATQVKMLPIRISCYWEAFYAILAAVEGYTAGYWTGLGFNDVKFLFHAILANHFAPWSAVFAGMQAGSVAGTYQRVFAGGSYSTPPDDIKQLLLYTPLVRSLARTYHYAHDGCHYYPALWYDADVTQASYTILSATGTTFTTTWNWTTGLNSGAETVAVGYATTITTVANLWNTAMQKSQSNVPISRLSGISTYNACSASYVTSETNKYILNILSMTPPTDEHIPILKQTVLPEYVAKSTDYFSQIGPIQAISGQHYHNTIMDKALTQANSLKSNIITAVHEKYSSGSAEASTKVDNLESFVRGADLLRAASGLTPTTLLANAVELFGAPAAAYFMDRLHGRQLQLPGP